MGKNFACAEVFDDDVILPRDRALYSDGSLARACSTWRPNPSSAAWKPPSPRYTRGYGAIFSQHVTQANEGCDFAVLADRSEVPEPDIY